MDSVSAISLLRTVEVVEEDVGFPLERPLNRKEGRLPGDC